MLGFGCVNALSATKSVFPITFVVHWDNPSQLQNPPAHLPAYSPNVTLEDHTLHFYYDHPDCSKTTTWCSRCPSSPTPQTTSTCRPRSRDSMSWESWRWDIISRLSLNWNRGLFFIWFTFTPSVTENATSLSPAIWTASAFLRKTISMLLEWRMAFKNMNGLFIKKVKSTTFRAEGWAKYPPKGIYIRGGKKYLVR